jgi:transposase InsO family protein
VLGPWPVECMNPKTARAASGRTMITTYSTATGTSGRFYNPKRRHSTIGYLSPMEF